MSRIVESHRFLDGEGERVFCRLAQPAAGSGFACSALVLHGGGQAGVDRHRTLLQELAGHGVRALGLDFSGHGRSTGALRDQSLSTRFRQARQAVHELLPERDALLLAGFSMSGQTVADLVAEYGERVRAIALLAPAVYARAAWEARFGNGFTSIIRTPGSWQDSRALDVFRGYTGTAVLGVPGADAVIPPPVTAAVEGALRRGARFQRMLFPEADHRLGAWLAEHPGDRRRLVQALTAGLLRRSGARR